MCCRINPLDRFYQELVLRTGLIEIMWVFLLCVFETQRGFGVDSSLAGFFLIPFCYHKNSRPVTVSAMTSRRSHIRIVSGHADKTTVHRY